MNPFRAKMLTSTVIPVAVALGVGVTVWLTAPDDPSKTTGMVVPLISRDVAGVAAVIHW